jgi:hypothetical protein
VEEGNEGKNKVKGKAEETYEVDDRRINEMKTGKVNENKQL